MSSLAAAPERAGQGAPGPPSRPARLRPGVDTAVIVLIAAATFALAILTSGNSDPDVPVGGSWAWPEIVTTLVGAGACAVAIAIGGRGRRWGMAPAGLFALFTAFAALSILWSVQPDWSWYGTDQLLAYLSAFAGAVALARVFPERWTALVGGMAVGMTALAGYSLLAKVFPSTLAAANTYGRLQAPFGYWNAIGLAAAMGVPACLWAATRRDAARLTRALAAPAMTVLFTAIVLSYSRSSALVAVVGAAVFVAFVPLRLRSALMLAVSGLGTLPIAIWALGNHALTTDNIAAAGPGQRRALVRDRAGRRAGSGRRGGLRGGAGHGPGDRARVAAAPGGHGVDRARRAGPGRRHRRPGRIAARADRRDLARLAHADHLEGHQTTPRRD